MSTTENDADGSTDSNNNDDNSNELVNVSSIDNEGEWVNLEAEVEELWEPNSDSIAQVGLLRDDSGVVKFVSWAKSEVPEMEEGEAYSIESVVTDEYEGSFSVNLNSATDVEVLDEEIATDGSGDGNGDSDADSEGDNSNPLVNCDDVDSDGEWIDIEAEVDQLWEPNTDSIAQVGLLSDDSGALKFTSWEKSELPEVEEGQSYRFENVVTNEYGGSNSVNLNSNTEIEQIDE